MKVLISVLSLFVTLINGQLRCFHCENQPTLAACLTNGKIDNCQSNQRACATEVRRRGNNVLYFKSCKQSLACMNNEIQNLRAAATPTQCNVQGDGSVCRCCCFFNECGRQENCTDIRPVPPTVEPIPTPNVPEERCRIPPEWENGQVLCPEEHPNGGFSIGSTCEYKCFSDHELIGPTSTTCKRMFNEETGQTELGFFPAPPCCEAPCSTRAKADVVFVLDSSTSIGRENWGKILNFVLNVAEEVPVSPSSVQFSVITYGRQVYKRQKLSFFESRNFENFVDSVIAIPYINRQYGTYTATALRYTARNAFTTENGYRSNVKNRFVIFVTDGMTSRKEPLDLAEAAEELKMVATKVYAVGINIHNRRELNLIASSEKEVSTIGFNELSGSTILQQIAQFVCDPECSPPNNPEEGCRLPPIWAEGDVICPPQTGSGWTIGDMCEYKCQLGYQRVGNNFTTCTRVTDPETGVTEVLFPDRPPCCEAPCSAIIVADIVFVVDSSTSIGVENWPKILNFILDIAELVPISPKRVQFGLITYGPRVYYNWVLPLNVSKNLKIFRENVFGTPYLTESYGTYTPTALRFTAEHAFTPKFGYRPDVKNRLVIFITDGMTSKEEADDLLPAIRELKRVVKKIYAVGIDVRDRRDESELLAIAGSPEDYSRIGGFNELSGGTLLQQITSFVCDSTCSR